MTGRFCAMLAAALLMGAAAQAQQASMPGMAMGAMPGHTQAAAPNAMQAEMMPFMERMNRDMMAAPPTGNPDRDFVTMMIPHHQGAIDMARIYLKSARDPAIRRLAQGVIRDQEREIREMRAWLAKQR